MQKEEISGRVIFIFCRRRICKIEFIILQFIMYYCNFDLIHFNFLICIPQLLLFYLILLFCYFMEDSFHQVMVSYYGY